MHQKFCSDINGCSEFQITSNDTLQANQVVSKVLSLNKSSLRLTEITAPSPQQHPSSTTSFNRAREIIDITWKEWIVPVGRALYTASSFPKTWDDFWSLRISKLEQNKMTTTSISISDQFTQYIEKLGVTFVKFGQALSARPDIVSRPVAMSLSKLQDSMDVSRGLNNRTIVQSILREELMGGQNKNNNPMNFTQEEWDDFFNSLLEIPEAAASIGVVYSAYMPRSQEKICIKIQRPDIEQVVKQDAQLLQQVAEFLESVPAIPRLFSNQQSACATLQQNRLIQTNLTGAVDEFMSRIFEELDYQNECNNLEVFGSLYSHRRSQQHDVTDKNKNSVQIVVPKVYREMCTKKVLVMEWIDGIKLIDLQRQQETDPSETLDLIKQGIDCTLSQLLETGVLHADPHGGNLLKIMDGEQSEIRANDRFKLRTLISRANKPENQNYRLGYVDFGLVSFIPSTVRDGLVCAVAQLVFARNVTAVANLFGDLQLLPEHVLEDSLESAALAKELEDALSQVLVYKQNSSIPTLRFDKLLDVLTRLVPRFQFQLPPYFLNNARALSTLEGMAREADPTFNVMQILYPYAIRRLFSNPTSSDVVDATLNSLVEDPKTGRIDPSKLNKLLDDASKLSGYSRRRVARDVLKTKNGSRLARRLAKESILTRTQNNNWLQRRIQKMVNYLRL